MSNVTMQIEMRDGIRELSMDEVDQVNGGIWQFFAGAVAGGYIYDSIGGKGAVDDWARTSWAATKGSYYYWYNKYVK